MRTVLLLSLCALVPTQFLHAQTITGFSTAAATRERQLEARLIAVPDPASAQRHSRVLSARPHVAGTPAQTATANYVLQQMASWGLDTSRVAFRVYLPYHDSTIVERITPTRLRLDLREPPVAGDPTTELPDQWPAMNGNSGKGDVTAALVYVNYGLQDDYARLDSLGVSVRGRVVIARYGRSFRGIKAREAEARGAVGLLLYSDPQDDGFVRGGVYPDGAFRSAEGVQRGSIFGGNGDPTTPGWASTADARRIPEDSLAVPHIPVVPIGYANAGLLMREMDGAAVPSGWQGGMKFDYRVGGGTVRARVAVWPERGPRAFKTIYNTFGTIRGEQFPNELVIVGGHRDAWGPGADDNVSGVVSILEAARAWGTQVRAGTRPRRTLIFATWDAEEWGLVGSTEWVELMRDSLKAKAVAYINQDESAAGRLFGASGTASLHELVREVTKTVQQPGDTVTVYSRWARVPAAGNPPPNPPTLGDLGGGSDFAGFYNQLGIASIGFGFGGQGGAYHSAYDTYTHMERFGDVGYLAHAAAGRLDAVLMARLANADVIPYDFAALGAYIGQLARRTVVGPAASAILTEVTDLTRAAEELERAGQAYATARDSALKSGVVPGVMLAATNNMLRHVEQALTRPDGLVGRPWMRNLIFASDRDNGYANVALPGITEAMQDGDSARVRREVLDLSVRIRAAAALVEQARTELLRGRAGR